MKRKQTTQLRAQVNTSTTRILLAQNKRELRISVN